MAMREMRRRDGWGDSGGARQGGRPFGGALPRWVLALVALAIGQVWPAAAEGDPVNPPAHLRVDSSPTRDDVREATSYAPVVKRVAPSVVNVFTTKMVPVARNHPFLDDPTWRRFFGLPGDGEDSGRRSRARPQQGLGSGVLVTEDGYILTNNHVVDGADEIKVGLSDGRTEYEARVVGKDPLTDLAVLKVDATNLPAITITDSDRLEVGDAVLAIGNPLGVGQTVTRGIVSALGRSGFGVTLYEDFIQTDAAINPGNSGGALVDAQGRLVGINTFIFSRSGGSQGIGFATPINLARPVMDAIIQRGKVSRGFLGVELEAEVTPDHVKAFGLPDDQGALVTKVLEDGASADAGIKEGDFITEFNGKKVTDRRSLQFQVGQAAPGTKAVVKLIRDGKVRTVTVVLKERELAISGLQEEAAQPEAERGLAGVTLAELGASHRRQFGIPENVDGVFVAAVDPDSAAAEKELREGSVILEINKKAVRSVREATLQIDQAEGRVLLRVWEPGNTVRFIVIDLDKDR